MNFIFSPDQTVDMICDYIAQSRMPSVHAVAYNCSSPDAIVSVNFTLFNVVINDTFTINVTD